MKYEKPKLQILNLALDKAIANASGLSDWLSANQFDQDVANNITTYVVNS